MVSRSRPLEQPVAAVVAPVAPLRAHLLGPVRLAIGHRPIAEDAWPRRAPRSLLRLLLATPGHVLPRDRVLDGLWPEAGCDAAANGLSKALRGLRQVLEPGLGAGRASADVATSRAVVRPLPVPGTRVDVAFEVGLAAAASLPDQERRPTEAAALFRDMGDRGSAGIAAANAADALRRQGDPGAPLGEVLTALTPIHESGHAAVFAECAELAAEVLGGLGEGVRAIRVVVPVDRLRGERDLRRPAPNEAQHTRAVAAHRASVGEDVFAGAWGDGRAMTESDIVAEVQHGLSTIRIVSFPPGGRADPDEARSRV